jgi:hypothetical protein
MRNDVLLDLDRILGSTDEADDVLRGAVALLASLDGVDWVGVAFLEGGELRLGPTAGRASERGRTHVPIAFHDEPVGELLVDGAAEADLLARVAERISPYVLIGWDTGGETWEP